MMLDRKRWVVMVALLAGASAVWGCSDDEGGSLEAQAGSSGKAGASGAAGKDSGGAGKAQGDAGDGQGGEAGSDAGGSSGDTGDAGAAGGATGPVNVCPALPSVLSVSGCAGVGPLCAVSQNDCEFSANCGGKIFAGTLSAAGAYSMKPPDTTATDGTKTAIQCNGETRFGRTIGKCDITNSGGTLTAPETSACTLTFDSLIQPSVTCLDLPKTLDDLTICKEGAAAGGTTIAAGKCSVIQDGCNFQATCANDVTLAGTVTKTAVSFRQTLEALADAQTPTTGTNPMPTFLKGADVAHTCTATIEGTSLKGSCGAGASGRTGVNTSVCAVESTVSGKPPVCSALSTKEEQLFVLDSCELLKEGEGVNPGIGEPVCALRQNNCIWEVQCGEDLKFSGRLPDATTKTAQWRLETGTPCEAAFDSAGKLVGKCTVPGQDACELTSKPAVAGGVGCPALPLGTQFYTKGCAGGSTVCSDTLQHGCNFLALCDFAGSHSDLIIAGKASKTAANRSRLDFNGTGTYQCYVEEANATDIGVDLHTAGEWFGQCTSSTGGQCRNTWSPTNLTGFRGLQLWFGTPPVAP